MTSQKIVIIAGETSGDQHAAHLVNTLKKTHANITFSGIGGEKMRAAGVTLIHDLTHFNIMGFTEVIKHLKVIRQIFNHIATYLEQTQPDLLILIDYPGFNLRLAKRAKAMGIKVLYYIGPQLWAWKPNRIKIIQKNVDSMAVIFPFEKKIYEDAGVPVHFVGHPLIQTMQDAMAMSTTGSTTNKKMIGILPGSRRGEIKRMFPIMLKAAELLQARYPDLIFILPVALTLSQQDFIPYTTQSTLPIQYVTYDYHLIQACHSVMVTSGTATLETALLAKPMVITYKTSLLNYTIGIQVVRVPYIGLCNLLAQKMIVPEILQQDLTPENLFHAMQRFLDEPDYYQSTVNALLAIRHALTADTTTSLADVVWQLLAQK